MSNDSNLQNRTAIVTGASSGIGRAIAESLGAAGAHVFLASRSREPMEESAKKIENDGGKATVLTFDARDPAQVSEIVDEAVKATGRLDIMVNNAGLSFPSKIVDADPEEWRMMLDTNVLGLLAGCQAAVRAMRSCSAEGHIVNISSIAAQRIDSGVYGATKHAVNAISGTLRSELEEDSIRVVTIMPGAIATNFARNFDPEFLSGFVKMSGLDVEIERGKKLPDEVLDKVQPLLHKLLGAPEDVANAVLYAVSQPINVNIAEIVVRPPKQLNL